MSAIQSGPDVSDRRADPRLAPNELPVPAVVRIQDRPAISVVDLSAGGALLELPFQLQPETRVTLELHTAAEHLAVPFQLIRCYVADLKGGVRYRAAGAFAHELKLPAVAAAPSKSETADSLIATLGRFLRTNPAGDIGPRGAHFNEVLSGVATGLQRGESARLLSIKIKAHLAQLFPSLAYPCRR